MKLKRVYKKIVKEYHVTVSEIQEEMQAAITAAYNDPSNDNEITRAFQ